MTCESGPERGLHVALHAIPAVPPRESTVAADEEAHRDPEDMGLTTEHMYVSWDSEDDPENPMNWPRSRKWLMSWVGISFCALVYLSVSAYVRECKWHSVASDFITDTTPPDTTPRLYQSTEQPSLIEDLNTSEELAILGISMFTITCGIAPLVLAPLSEVWGRTPVYNGSAFVFFISYLPQALADNIALVLVFRFISGIGGSTAISLVSGTLTDVWNREDRGLPMALFAFAAFFGSGLGPVVFGYVEMNLGWRYINWILFAASGALTAAIAIVCRETRASVILSRKAARLRKEMGDPRYTAEADEERNSFSLMVRTSLSRPLYLLFTEPILIAFSFWIAFAWGVLYLILEILPPSLTSLYGFNSGQNGLAFVSEVVGAFLGLAINAWSDRKYRRNVDRKGCEARLYIAMVCGLLFPIGTIFYTWTLWTYIHWIVPLIGVAVLYAGMYGIYTCTWNYLSDSYNLYAASALSGQSFVRNCFGASFPLFAMQMYRGLGAHYAGTLLACVAFLLSAIPFVLFKYGHNIRAKSKFAAQLARLAGEEEKKKLERWQRSEQKDLS